MNTRRKFIQRAGGIILVLLCLSLMGLTIYSVEPNVSESYASGIFCKRLKNVTPSGDFRTDIVNIAMSQIGYTEGNSKTEISGCTPGTGNYTEFGLWYNNRQDAPGGYEKAAWCAMFVSWCAYQAGIPSDTV